MTDLTVAFWNRGQNASIQPQAEYLAHGPVPWDVAILAEVRKNSFRQFCDAVEPSDAVHALDVVSVTDMKFPQGIAILARGGLRLADVSPMLTDCADDPLACRSERGLAATVGLGGSVVRLVGWHARYAAGSTREEKRVNPLRKQHSYQHFLEWLETQPEPVVLGMDGNNTYDFLHAEDEPPLPPDHDAWADEHTFHGPAPTHGLVDTLRAVVQREAERADSRREATQVLAVTRRNKHMHHRMDRLYVSPSVSVVDAGVDHTGKSDSHLTVGSDHALVWAKVAID